MIAASARYSAVASPKVDAGVEDEGTEVLEEAIGSGAGYEERQSE